MKKLRFLMTFFVLLAWRGHAAADNVVTTNEPYIVPGGTTELVVSLECDQDFQIYAYNFYLYLPEGIEVEKTALGTYMYELKPRNANHNSNVGKTGDGSIMFGIDHPDIPLTGYQGEVLGITLKASPTLAVGTYTGYIRRIACANNSHPVQGRYPADMSFSIVVGDRVILDETSTTVPAAADGVDVLVKRTIAANEWGTICLPFAMSAEQVTAAFGDDVKLCDFTGHDYEEAANGDITSITMNFEAVTPLAIEANHPYIIKVSNPVTQFEVNNVDIVPETEPCIEFDNGKTGRNRVVYSGFYGTYQANTPVEEFCLFLSGGNFYYSKGLTKMKAFRGFFWTQEILSKVENAAGAKIGFNIDGETTGIDNSQLSTVNSNDGWYTLDGIKLNGEPKKKGIYIKDGRKVVVK